MLEKLFGKKSVTTWNALIDGVASRSADSAKFKLYLKSTFTFHVPANNRYQFIETGNKFRSIESALINKILAIYHPDHPELIERLRLSVPKKIASQFSEDLDRLHNETMLFDKLLYRRFALLDRCENLLSQIPLDSPIDLQKEHNKWISTRNDEDGMLEVAKLLESWSATQIALSKNIITLLNNLELIELEGE